MYNSPYFLMMTLVIQEVSLHRPNWYWKDLKQYRKAPLWACFV